MTIFMGAVWAYIVLFLLLGPEMVVEERAEYAKEAIEIDTARRSGMSLDEMGRRRTMGEKLMLGGNEAVRVGEREKEIPGVE